MEKRGVWNENIDMTKIELRDNVRIDRDVSQLQESIKHQGLLQPVCLLVDKEIKGRYILIFGYSRFKACQNLGWNSISAMVTNIDFDSEEEMQKYFIITQLTENTARREADPIAQGRYYNILIEKYGMTIAELSSTTGRPKGQIINDIEIFERAPDELRRLVARGMGRHSKDGKLVATTVRLLSSSRMLKIDDEQRKELYDYVRKNELTQKEVQILGRIMFDFNCSFAKALEMSKQIRSIQPSIFIRRDVENMLVAKYKLSISMIIQSMLEGKIPINSDLVYTTKKQQNMM